MRRVTRKKGSMLDAFGNHVRPVFLLGVTQRTGTHLLEALLALHPECCFVGPRPVSDYWTFEDYLLQHAHLLERYATGTRRHWSAPWGGDRTVDATLLEGIGAGLFQAFTSLGKPATGSVALLRTPSVANLELVPKLFLDAQVIVVVRQPLAVAASGERSFGSAFRSSWPDEETWISEWRAGSAGCCPRTRSWVGVACSRSGSRISSRTGRRLCG
ncbi:MAG: sulfotransferase [Acidimicrobiia bacterium]